MRGKYFRQEQLMKFKYRWHHFFDAALMGLAAGLSIYFFENNPALIVLFTILIGAILVTIGTVIRVKVNDYLK